MIDDAIDDEKWLQEQQMLHNIQSNYCRELMDSIQLQFVFLDTNKHITHITSMREPLNVCDASNQCLLKEDRIIALLSNIKKQYPSKKFTLHHISSFLVDLEPEHIQVFSNSDCSEQSPFLQQYSIVQSICIPPSIFIFHNVNTLYFFLQEIPCSHQRTLKSILKKKEGKQSSGSSNKTKRVRIQHDDDKQELILHDVARHRKTRRQTP